MSALSSAKQALRCVLIQNRKLEANSLKIPDLARNESVVHVNRIEKYFVNEAWVIVLGALAKNRNFPGSAQDVQSRQKLVKTVLPVKLLNLETFSLCTVALLKKPKTKFFSTGIAKIYTDDTQLI